MGRQPAPKAAFLANVAHFATIAARESYAPSDAYPDRDYDHPDAIILRDANNFVHRVTGYIPHVLYKSEGQGQDASVMTMVLEYFQERGIERHLAEWLERANSQS